MSCENVFSATIKIGVTSVVNCLSEIVIVKIALLQKMRVSSVQTLRALISVLPVVRVYPALPVLMELVSVFVSVLH